MKSSIITIHHIHNFGSVFQGYALYKFLLNNGVYTEIIDYRPEYYNSGKNKFKTFVGRALNLKSYLTRAKKFEAFISRYDNLSEKPFLTVEQLREHYLTSDNVFVSGGDQLWNNYHPCGNDPAYKLSFTSSKRKLAYGTSMGRDNFTEDELSTLASQVSDFSSIMLREQSTVEMLKKHSVVPTEHVIDPVGLLDISEFQKIAIKPKIKEPYAVMYLADSSELLDEAIRILGEELGLKIVHICGFKKKCKCDYFVKDAGPEEILGYILNADFVLSASFHATMFSLLANKQFASLLPGEKTNARIVDILSYVGLQDRVIHSTSELSKLLSKIDFSEANERIAAFKARSAELLLKNINELMRGI